MNNDNELYNDFKKLIDDLKNVFPKPKLLLHACCAPCSSACLELLVKAFDITIFYSNDNISPKEEYDKRLNEIIKFSKNVHNIKVINEPYINEDFNNAIKGHEADGEKSYRCFLCYSLRLRKTAIYAKENGYDYFTTTLSISPYKVTRWINEIGFDLEKKLGIKYLYSNFKKENGYKRSIELSKEYGLYRQDYCGCIYSKKEREAIINDRIIKENNN